MNNKSATDHNSNSMIAQLRAIRDKISLEIKDMNKEQMKAYFKKRKLPLLKVFASAAQNN
jgi:hypothetical protein